MISLISNIVAGISIWGILFATIYCSQHRSVQDPASAHVPLTGVGCLLAGIGFFGQASLIALIMLGVSSPYLDFFSFLSPGLIGLGLFGCAAPILWWLPAITAQPSLSVALELERLQEENKRLREERNKKTNEAIQAKVTSLRTRISLLPPEADEGAIDGGYRAHA